MLPRYTSQPSSNIRKSSNRLENRPSFLPKPRRPGSTDRVSVEGRRPSGIRSNSAEPRTTIGGGRLSREASATKIPLNRRSRSQQCEERRYGHVSMTPLRPSNLRPTATPRTPSEDRSSCNWQMSLDRVNAAITVKDNRPLSNAAWQRAEVARIQEALAARGPEGNNTTLIRPLTIARFVDITRSLLTAIIRDPKLNNDNYVTKLPHTAKRLLYPGTVSKSWLRTVNTLHAFPQALALIAYLVDLVNRIEAPVDDEKLYACKDELACLRRQYLYKCWIRFQDPDYNFEDINEEYLQQLKLLLGNDEERIQELQQIVNEMQLSAEDEAELAARAAEARRNDARAALLAALRGERAARTATRAAADAAAGARRTAASNVKALLAEVARAGEESQQLKRELEEQTMTVVERTKLLEEVDYAHRVIDSKTVLAQQISKMVLSKETELALWQKKTLDSCVEYKQGLIHLSTAYPELARLAVDEKELMGEDCMKAVASALEALHHKHAALLQRVTARERERHTDRRQKAHYIEELRSKLIEAKSELEREQNLLEEERTKESHEAAAFVVEERGWEVAREGWAARGEGYARAEAEGAKWEAELKAWTTKMAEFREHIASQREQARRTLQEAKLSRANRILETVATWNSKLDLVCNQ